MTEKVTLAHLESHLWGAADILRGRIDSGEYKTYIFGLLFYKRLSDVWEEEYEARLKEYGDKTLAADPEEHRFYIPKGCFWEDVCAKSTNIGETLNIALRAIEDANQRLRGLFQDVDFNSKERFPDDLLARLLQHFSKFRMRNSDIEADVLGNAYEYLIAKFADDAGAKGGEFYTPKMVVRLIVECIEPEEGQSIYDPTCGSGGMLLEAYHSLQRRKLNAKSLHMYGQEININTWAICQMNLFLHNLDDAVILRGDTIRNPRHLEAEGGRALKKFDRVMANPPFSLKNWGQEVWAKGDTFGRDVYGCPPASYGDLAFVQHMVASLKDKGRMGVVLPHGISFRGGKEAEIRKGLIETDLIEGVIGLASNLFYGAGIPACILLINKDKPGTRKKKMVIVNGAAHYREGKAQNFLDPEHVETFAKAFTEFKDIEKLARVVGNDEIAKNDFNLNAITWKSGPALLNQRVLHLSSGEHSLLNERFLFYFIQPLLKIIQDQTAAATVKHLSVKQIASRQMFLPTLIEQEIIGKLLDSVSCNFELCSSILAQTRRLKQALLQQLLTKGIDENGRPHTQFKDSGVKEIGRIPERWEVKTLHSLVAAADGGVSVNGENRPANFDEKGVLKISAVTSGSFDESEYTTILSEDLSRAKVHPKSATVIFSRANTADLVGASAYIEKDYENLFLPYKLWRLEASKGTSPRWLGYVLRKLKEDGVLKGLATGSNASMKNISKEKFFKLSVATPTLCEQVKISDGIMRAERFEKEQVESLTIQKQLKSALMSDLLTGRVRVKDLKL